VKSKDVFPGVFSRHARAYRDRMVDQVPTARLMVVELVGPQEGERVLDLACGPGTITLDLAAAVGPRGRVLAIDLADGMLELLREVAPPWVETQRMDIEQLHLPSASFDVVTCGHGYHFVPDLAHALAEARRVLVEGGRFAASVPITGGSGGVADLVGDVFAGVPPPPETPDRESTVAILDDAARLAALMESAGFRDVRVDRVEEEARFADAETLTERTFSWWQFAWRLEQLDEARAAELRQDVRRAIDERVTEWPFVTTNWSAVFSGHA